MNYLVDLGFDNVKVENVHSLAMKDGVFSILDKDNNVLFITSVEGVNFHKVEESI